MLKLVAYLGIVLFAGLFFTPAALTFAGWKRTRNIDPDLPRWRRISLFTGLIAAFCAWLLLAALELPLYLFRTSYEQIVPHTFWTGCVLLGILISAVAVTLCLLGRGYARRYALLGALGVFFWWYLLAFGSRYDCC